MTSMGRDKFYKLCQGKVGNIYIARRATVTVYEIEGVTYLINNLCTSAVIVNPADSYWCHSIDWSGNFSDYKMAGMYPADTQRFSAKPLSPITDKYRDNLRKTVEYWRSKAVA